MSKKRLYRGDIARRLLMRYVMTILFFIVALLTAFYGAKFLLTRSVWQGTEPMYIFAKTVQTNFQVWFPVVIVIATVIITYLMFLVPLGYVEELVDAAEKLVAPSKEPIQLSDDLASVQDKLNLVREMSLRNAWQAKEAEQRKNDLIVYLAHDLKTPLTSVIGYLTLLRDEPDISPKLRCRYTGIALEKAERLEDLINEFFDITRFNLTTLTLEPERINLSRMLEQIAYEFNPILAEKDLKWHNQIAADVEIIADPDKLERVFDNLIRNAVNYSYSGTDISLVMRCREEQVEITVSNHGKTIPQDKLNRIFEQFFRLDSSRCSATGGAGLGLAIAKEIVEMHHGTIAAESADESICFSVTLPRNTG
ncbi:MAG: HAMP domain-containing sensor histidine kinase [Clostridiales bacterium]|nr:HAMP domain-containing sensor histidine kinase [Clostridiales bacterium]